MKSPAPRGPVSAALLHMLTAAPEDRGTALVPPPCGALRGAGLDDDDLQLALYVCYEMHYSGFDDIDPRWEWSPALLGARAELEDAFESALRAEVAAVPASTPEQLPRALALMVEADDGPPLAGYLRRTATLEQFQEYLMLRSLYQLKEADPHTWAIPRLGGRAKAALVEIQSDEYGGGRVEAMHSELFRHSMRGLGLDDSYGAYLEDAPAVVLALNNLMSFFGLHRRRVGALLGHLAAFEMTSSLPNRDHSSGLRRLGADRSVRRYFDEHVEADAVHEQIAAHDMCGGFAQDHPELCGDILFGAAACLALDRLLAAHVLDSWRDGASALRAAPSAVTA